MKNKKITNEELMKEIKELKRQLAEKQPITIINVPQVPDMKPVVPDWKWYPGWYDVRPYYINGSSTIPQVLC